MPRPANRQAVRAAEGEAHEAGRFVLRSRVRRFRRSDAIPGVERAVARPSQQHRNIYNVPLLGTGNPVFYLNLHFLAERFWHALPSGSGLTRRKLWLASRTRHWRRNGRTSGLEFPPCYAIARRERTAESSESLFAGTIVTGPGYGAVEIYPGQQVTQSASLLTGSPKAPDPRRANRDRSASPSLPLPSLQRARSSRRDTCRILAASTANRATTKVSRPPKEPRAHVKVKTARHD